MFQSPPTRNTRIDTKEWSPERFYWINLVNFLSLDGDMNLLLVLLAVRNLMHHPQVTSFQWISLRANLYIGNHRLSHKDHGAFQFQISLKPIQWSSILIGFSIINQAFSGFPIYGNPHMGGITIKTWPVYDTGEPPAASPIKRVLRGLMFQKGRGSPRSKNEEQNTWRGQLTIVI